MNFVLDWYFFYANTLYSLFMFKILSTLHIQYISRVEIAHSNLNNMTHLVIWSTKLAFIFVRLSVRRNNVDWVKLIVLISLLPLALPVCISFKFLCRSWWWWLGLVWSGLNLGKLSIKRTSMSRQRRHYIMSVCSHWLVFQVITWSEPFLPIGWSDQTITLHSSLEV